MRLIKKNFSGIDASNEISLLEYGLLVYNKKHEDNSGTQFCVYKQGEMFGTGHISQDEINELLKGNSWADKDSLDGFFSFVGSNADEYINEDNLVNKLYDLISYYSTENIMGCDYCPITEKEAVKKYLK